MTGDIYTRRGDTGETSLVGGARVRKDCARVTAYGTVDELSSQVGLALASLPSLGAETRILDDALEFSQQRLFNCSSNLATPADPPSPNTPTVTVADITALERWIDVMTIRVGGFPGFVLPGGCETAARLHVARTVARRAEREILTLATTEPVDTQILAFVNRLSDLLFTAARYANIVAGSTEVLWDPKAEPPTA